MLQVVSKNVGPAYTYVTTTSEQCLKYVSLINIAPILDPKWTSDRPISDPLWTIAKVDMCQHGPTANLCWINIGPTHIGHALDPSLELLGID